MAFVARARRALPLAAIVGGLVACRDGVGPQASCSTSSASALALGEVKPAISKLSVCVAGGAAGAEYAVIPFNSSTTYSSKADVSFTSTGATAATGSALSRLPTPGGVASMSLDASGDVFGDASFAERFDQGLRLRESRALPQRFEAARAWRLAASQTKTGLRPSFMATNYTVGQIVTFNANANDACSVNDPRTGRVVAVTNRAIVVADTGNPSGGYTDTEYQSIAVNFDTLVYDLNVTNFGAPSDIDGNGKVILFFSRAVNELTPANSGSVVGGFFYARDLFPRTDPNVNLACVTSNMSEMFYLIVPDPNGVINGNVRSKTSVSRIVISTTSHEFQHLINASRRLYINTAATDFEETWLNEGLSHIAEELLFYREAGLTPRTDFDSLKLDSSTRIFNAFLNDQSSNFGRYGTYLPKTTTSSPYAPNDSLQTRGATWSFLRYAADQGSTPDATVWFALVNSTTRGIANLQNVFGGATAVTALFRDWATSHLMDDIPGAPARYQQPSWNWRSLFLRSSLKSFPLATQTVSDATPLTVTLNGGSVGYVRFKVPADGVAEVKWAQPPTSVLFTLVRFR